MTTQQYLSKLLEEQSLAEDSKEIKALQDERKKVEEILRNNFMGSNPSIRYGGSKAKHTMIRDNYDLDITCYFAREDKKAGTTIKEIYENVKKALDTKYLVQRKTSALRLENNDPENRGVYFHIDVVPGRFIDETETDTFLHLSNKDGWLQTNLEKHLDYVKGSGFVDEIKLTKLWKVRNGLQIRTFVLELLVIKILKSKNKDGSKLDDCMKTFWEALRDEINDITIEDPANSGNSLSEFFDDEVKSLLSSAAKQSLGCVDADNWVDIFGDLGINSIKEKTASVLSIAVKTPDRPRPWGY